CRGYVVYSSVHNGRIQCPARGSVVDNVTGNGWAKPIPDSLLYVPVESTTRPCESSDKYSVVDRVNVPAVPQKASQTLHLRRGLIGSSEIANVPKSEPNCCHARVSSKCDSEHSCRVESCE